MRKKETYIAKNPPKKQECEVAPRIENNRTLVPLRIVSEALRKKVEWDEDSQTIIIEDAEQTENTKSANE